MFSFFIKQPSENFHIRILFKFLINIFNCETEFIAGKIKKVDKSFCILYYYTNYSTTEDRTTKQKNCPIGCNMYSVHCETHTRSWQLARLFFSPHISA